MALAKFHVAALVLAKVAHSPIAYSEAAVLVAFHQQSSLSRRIFCCAVMVDCVLHWLQ